MTTQLELTTECSDGATVLTATGEIDMSNADTFTAALAHAITPGRQLTVDLSAVGYLDSAGLTALFVHAEHIHLVVQPMLVPVLTVSGLLDLTTVTVGSP